MYVPQLGTRLEISRKYGNNHKRSSVSVVKFVRMFVISISDVPIYYPDFSFQFATLMRKKRGNNKDDKISYKYWNWASLSSSLSIVPGFHWKSHRRVLICRRARRSLKNVTRVERSYRELQETCMEHARACRYSRMNRETIPRNSFCTLIPEMRRDMLSFHILNM